MPLDLQYELDQELSQHYVIEVHLEMGAKCNVCNYVGPYHKHLKYSMIRIIMIHTQF